MPDKLSCDVLREAVWCGLGTTGCDCQGENITVLKSRYSHWVVARTRKRSRRSLNHHHCRRKSKPTRHQTSSRNHWDMSTSWPLGGTRVSGPIGGIDFRSTSMNSMLQVSSSVLQLSCDDRFDAPNMHWMSVRCSFSFVATLNDGRGGLSFAVDVFVVLGRPLEGGGGAKRISEPKKLGARRIARSRSCTRN
jgi:hypothetical protein